MKQTIPQTYHTLDEIRLRKDQLSEEIEKKGQNISTIWNDLFTRDEHISKGEYIATLITNSITAIDAFIMIRKLIRNYDGVRSLFGLKSKKKRR